MDSLHIFFLILFLFILCNVNTENIENNNIENNNTKYYVNCKEDIDLNDNPGADNELKQRGYNMNSYFTMDTDFPLKRLGAEPEPEPKPEEDDDDDDDGPDLLGAVVDENDRILKEFYNSPICWANDPIKQEATSEQLNVKDMDLSELSGGEVGDTDYHMFYPTVLYGLDVGPQSEDETDSMFEKRIEKLDAITYRDDDNDRLLEIKENACLGPAEERNINKSCTYGMKTQ